MIYGQFKDKNINIDFLEKIEKFIQENDLSKFDEGKHLIQGEDFFVNIANYKTTTPENRVWEAHRKYIDVHYMISGSEIIKNAFLDKANIVKYHEDTDYVEIDNIAGKTVDVELKQGQYLICYTTDVHKTACIIEKEEMVKKAIFKVKI